MSNGTTNNLEAALASLKMEEEEINQQMGVLDEKLEELQDAISSIEVLLGITPQAEAKQPGQPLIPPRRSKYADLTIPEAVKKVLKDNGKALKAPEIAKALLTAGFKSKSKHFTIMVGVTLRRLEGEAFKRNTEGQWSLVS